MIGLAIIPWMDAAHVLDVDHAATEHILQGNFLSLKDASPLLANKAPASPLLFPARLQVYLP
jgi:hypothetical protein